MDDLPYIYVTTTGWKSGQPHRIEIWFVGHDGRYYLCAESRERAHWVQNIQRNPPVQIELGGVHSQGTARVVESETEAALAAAVRAKFDAKYDWSDGLLVELSPSTAA
jgi:deazaflavin-dependent oxidoreductase (nitroreductase family)